MLKKYITGVTLLSDSLLECRVLSTKEGLETECTGDLDLTDKELGKCEKFANDMVHHISSGLLSYHLQTDRPLFSIEQDEFGEIYFVSPYLSFINCSFLYKRRVEKLLGLIRTELGYEDKYAYHR